jgi:HEPN domain-containing protein
MSDRDPLAWWAYVESDLLTIDAAIAYHDVSWVAVAFHAQQAAEKALKAILVAREQSVPRVHDVLRLLRDVQRLTALDDTLVPACSRLNELGNVSRYPDDAGLISERHGRQAAADARDIVRVARAVLHSFDVPVP